MQSKSRKTALSKRKTFRKCFESFSSLAGSCPTMGDYDFDIAAWDSGGRELPPIHPGELLREYFMKPQNLSAELLAMAIPRHLDFPDHDIAESIRDFIRADEDDSLLSIDLALALDRYFGLSSRFFWRVQADNEIRRFAQTERVWLAKVKPMDSSRSRVRLEILKKKTASQAIHR